MMIINIIYIAFLNFIIYYCSFGVFFELQDQILTFLLGDRLVHVKILELF